MIQSAQGLRSKATCYGLGSVSSSWYLSGLHGGSFLTFKMERLFYSISHVAVYSGFIVEYKPHSYVSDVGE